MPNQLYKGTINNIILKLLHDYDKMYGYQIIKTIKEQTNNDLKITEGALYTVLHQLESDNILEVEYDKVKGRVRKYYKLSKKGKTVAVDKIKELKEFIDNLSIFLNPKSI